MISRGLLYLVLIFCIACASKTNSLRENRSGSSRYWKQAFKDYRVCRVGKKQSPINLVWKPPKQSRSIVKRVLSSFTKKEAIQYRYKKSPAIVFNRGWYLSVQPSIKNLAVVDGKEYRLKEIYFHTPSEHTLSGKGRDMEVQMEHLGFDGQVLIISVFFKKGSYNHEIEKILRGIPSKKARIRKMKTKLDATKFIPSIKTGYVYQGSLSKPPCSENAVWYVYNTPMTLSKTQLRAFLKHYNGNNRPVQRTNGRDVVNY